MTKVLELQLQPQSSQWTFRVGFLEDWLIWSPRCPRDSQECSPASQFENINFSALSLLVQISHPYMTTGKTIVLTIWTFVCKVMSLLFNMLSRFVSFSSKEKTSVNFVTAVTIPSDSGAQEKKICNCFHFFPIYLPWSDWARFHDLSFLNVEFKPAVSLFSFTLIKRLFSFSSLSAIKVAYFRFLIFLPAILIPACGSSSLAFFMMYFAYSLNNQGDNIQPWYTPFPIWNQSVVPYPVLTVASWPLTIWPRGPSRDYYPREIKTMSSQRLVRGQICSCFILTRTSLVTQMIKNLPAIQETWVQSLCWEDPLEKEMATDSSTLVWKIPWTEEPGKLQSTGSQRIGHNWATSLLLFCFIDSAKAFDYMDHNKFWKILQEMGISDYLTCLLKNLYFRLGSNS